MTGRGGRGEALRRLLMQCDEDDKSQAEAASEKKPTITKSLPRQPLGRGFARELLNSLAESSQTIESQKAPLQGRGRSRILSCDISCQGSQDVTKSTSSVKTMSKTYHELDTMVEPAFDPENTGRKPIVQMGSKGEKMKVVCNYIRLKVEEGKGVFKYDVKFDPPVDSLGMKRKILFNLSSTLGNTKTFDGCLLCLPYQLTQKVTILKTVMPSDQTPVTVRVTHVRTESLDEAIQLYNVLFRRAMSILGLSLMGRHYFDKRSAVPISQHKLEIWPGFITAIQEFEGGIMLCCDASHRILRTQTVYALLYDLSIANQRSYKEHFLKLIIGQTVLTRYNNRTYKVDDVDFSRSPKSLFPTRDGKEISFMEYYKNQYEITISDPDQPLLISRPKLKRRSAFGNDKGEEELISLIPELCYMSGLSDDLKADFNVMKEVASSTRLEPHQRVLALRSFIKNIKANEEASALLKSWGLEVEDGTISLDGRHLPPEKIVFGNNFAKQVTEKADWGNLVTSNSVLSGIDLKSWAILYPKRDEGIVNPFVEMLKKCGPQMGFAVDRPSFLPMNDDRVETYLVKTREVIARNEDVQMIVIVFTAARADKYSAIKKLLCTEAGIPSQAILLRTIKNPQKLRAVSQKVALQMNCKLGGTLWAVKIPLKDTMICGMDSYHDPSSKGGSVTGFVASLNEYFTRWSSKISKQRRNEEMGSNLRTLFLSSIMHYHRVRGVYPEQIVIFRDGISDGELNSCLKYECPQFMSCFEQIEPSYRPKFLMIIVQKRISTRIMQLLNGKNLTNPPPGTVLDHTVTKYSWFDFYLVSQSVRQGTVSPTHYLVVHNSTSMDPDKIQMLTYKMTHMYYNWPGTVRVPAPCQYAHKLAQLVGEATQKDAHEKLADKLYFL